MWSRNLANSQRYYYRPMASYQLAWWLRQHGHTAQVIDFIQHFSVDQLVDYTLAFCTSQTKIIAVTTVFWPSIPRMAPGVVQEAQRRIRALRPDIKWVGGGPLVNSYRDMFDYVIEGEGEDRLLTLVDELAGQELSRNQFDILHNAHQFEINDCILPQESLPMELGRGCIFKCRFCNYHNIGKLKGTYQRDLALVEASVQRNLDLFNTANYVFLDDTVNEDPAKIQGLAQINRRMGDRVNWVGFLRTDLIHSHANSDVLLASGLRQAFHGIESFGVKASSAVGKGWVGRHGQTWIPHLHDQLWQGRVGLELSFIVGLPGDTDQSLSETVSWLKANSRIRGYFNGLGLEFDSEFTRDSLRWGYIKHPQDRWRNSQCPPHWTGLTVQRIAAELNSQLEPSWPLTGFLAANLTAMGRDYDSIQSLMWRDAARIFYEEHGQFMRQYMSLLDQAVNTL